MKGKALMMAMVVLGLVGPSSAQAPPLPVLVANPSPGVGVGLGTGVGVGAGGNIDVERIPGSPGKGKQQLFVAKYVCGKEETDGAAVGTPDPPLGPCSELTGLGSNVYDTAISLFNPDERRHVAFTARASLRLGGMGPRVPLSIDPSETMEIGCHFILETLMGETIPSVHPPASGIVVIEAEGPLEMLALYQFKTASWMIQTDKEVHEKCQCGGPAPTCFTVP